jgi:ribosomal protein S18 acetylase RimI-like enzyme
MASNMVIRLAKTKDVPQVMAIVARCVSEMRAHGVDQWDEVYPNESVFREDVRSKSLFIAERDCTCVAAVALNDVQPEQYRCVPWRCADDRALVVHRLCVHPDHQLQGIGLRLMEFADAYARSRGFRSIRLEVYPTASAAVALYSRLGYTLVGQVRFPRRRLPFDCMELVLPKKTGPNHPPDRMPGTPAQGRSGRR